MEYFVLPVYDMAAQVATKHAWQPWYVANEVYTQSICMACWQKLQELKSCLVLDDSISLFNSAAVVTSWAWACLTVLLLLLLLQTKGLLMNLWCRIQLLLHVKVCLLCWVLELGCELQQ